ncbi:hypothetical protein [Actinokineospora sp. HUAS TT18]|uniref:hypothetical protein n=1 Tax=Actinokineospora sp. HUAS TT18 TaxID=3447451 RepID=UPI003F527325
MAVTSLIISILSALLTAGAVWYARGQRNAADKASEAAVRAAAAAAESVELQRLSENRASDAAERGKIDWKLDLVSGQRYILRNAGTHSAFGVHVEQGAVKVEGNETDFPEFPSNHGVELVLAKSYGQVNGPIVITWHANPTLSDKEERQEVPVI